MWQGIVWKKKFFLSFFFAHFIAISSAGLLLHLLPAVSLASLWKVLLLALVLPLPILYVLSFWLNRSLWCQARHLCSCITLLSQNKFVLPFPEPSDPTWRICFKALNQLRTALQAYREQYLEERKRDKLIQEISFLVNRFAPPEKTFPQLLPHLSQYLKANASLFLKRDGKLVEYTREKPPFEVAIGEGVAGVCARQKQQILANNAREHPAFVEGLTEFKHLLCLPLLAADELLGVVSFYRFEDPPFTEEEVEVATPVIRLLSSYLQNTILQEKIILDPKTKLFVYPFFVKRCEDEVHRARRYGTPFSIVLLDIDHFKQVNDRYGHIVGDQVLLAMARIIREEIRELDLPCRFGGEEFAILLPSSNAGAACACAERLLDRIRHADLLPEGNRLTASAGIAEFHLGLTIQKMLELADQALYRAKQSGRDRVCLNQF